MKRDGQILLTAGVILLALSLIQGADITPSVHFLVAALFVLAGYVLVSVSKQ